MKTIIILGPDEVLAYSEDPYAQQKATLVLREQQVTEENPHREYKIIKTRHTAHAPGAILDQRTTSKVLFHTLTA